MTINFKYIYFTLYFLVLSAKTIKILYLQYRFEDRCLLWVCKGRIMDIFFIKIK